DVGTVGNVIGRNIKYAAGLGGDYLIRAAEVGGRHADPFHLELLVVARVPIPDGDVGAVAGGRTRNVEYASAVLCDEADVAAADIFDAEALAIIVERIPLLDVRAVGGAAARDVKHACFAGALRPNPVVSIALMFELEDLVCAADPR